MPVSRHDLAIFAARVVVITDEVNKEHRMSVQVQQLADVVRKAQDAIRRASTAAERMQGAAIRVVDRVAEVEGVTTALIQAEADLTAALGGSTNGGPPGPLPDTPPTSPADGIAASVVQVQHANEAST